ncbi:MAG: hypothetical protein AAGD38_01660 [Acidobacteriota bacterium]
MTIYLLVLVLLPSLVLGVGLVVVWHRARAARHRLTEEIARQAERLDRRADLLQSQLDRLDTLNRLEHIHRLLDSHGSGEARLAATQLDELHTAVHAWRREVDESSTEGTES